MLANPVADKRSKHRGDGYNGPQVDHLRGVTHDVCEHRNVEQIRRYGLDDGFRKGEHKKAQRTKDLEHIENGFLPIHGCACGCDFMKIGVSGVFMEVV